MNERSRRRAALAGTAMWLAFPFAYLAAENARWQQRCNTRTFTGSFDDCFRDGLPLSALSFPLTLCLAYAFARLAFSMFAPPAAARSLGWWLANKDDGSAYYPVFQIVAVVGILWAAAHLAFTPLLIRYWYVIGYWILWIGWFLLGGFASLPPSPRYPTED